MYRQKRITVCIPCRNEGRHLKKVIAQIPAIVDEIIVISNCSTDDTVSVARQSGALVIEENNTVNGIGYGFAHMAGLKRAKGDIIIGVDGDGSYPYGAIPNLVDAFLENKLDVASGNRYPLQSGVSIPLKLRIGVWLLNQEVRLLYGKRVKDILSGMWLVRKEVKDELQLTCGDWNLSPQIKLNAQMHPGIIFGELPIEQRQRQGSTHQNYFRTGISHFVWIAQNRLGHGREVMKYEPAKKV